MTQHFPLDYGDVVHEGFFDPIQELLGASLSLRIAVSNSSTLIIQAGAGNDQVSATLTNSAGTKAGFRWITAPITATIPGDLSNGAGSVYITAEDNDFSGNVSNPDSGTDYSFAMEIRASGTPTTDLWRKVGEVDVSGGAIVAFRAMGGPRPTGEFGLSATPDTASQPGILVTGRASQTGNLIETKNSSGSTLFSVSAAGATTQAGGITTGGVITASGNSGKATLNLSNTGTNTGITIGGDVELYRTGADALQTDDTVTIRRTSSSDTTLAIKVVTDSNDRTSITAGGEVKFGSGSATPDVRVRRSGSTTLTVDTPSAGAASLSVSGELTVGTNLKLTQATTAGHVPIADGTGLMNLGQLASASIASNAITTAKINDGAVTQAKIGSAAVGAAQMVGPTNAAVTFVPQITSGSWRVLRYPDGLVILRGVVDITPLINSPDFTQIATIPVGYRPDGSLPGGSQIVDVLVPTVISGGQPREPLSVSIYADGRVLIFPQQVANEGGILYANVTYHGGS